MLKRLHDRWIDQRAEKVAAKAIELMDEYPQLREWPRLDLVALAAECAGAPRALVRRIRAEGADVLDGCT